MHYLCHVIFLSDEKLYIHNYPLFAGDFAHQCRLCTAKIGRGKSDSILAVMPQLNDSEKDNALRLLIMLTTGTPDEKYYTRRYLDEARRQNVTVQ